MFGESEGGSTNTCQLGVSVLLVCVELILNFISCSVASASGVVGDCGRGWANNTNDFNSQTECGQFVNQSNVKPRSVDDICTDCVHYITVNRV